MRTLLGILVGTFFLLPCFAQSTPGTISPAEQKIRWAQEKIRKKPETYANYNELAMALARRAREISDVTYYKKADDALQKSLELAPNNFETQKIRAWILLGKHEFAKAAELAKALNQQMPDDILVYGFLADAHAELGNYREAEEAAQWMLDMRPGNVPGLTRGAYLRELFGDIEGALELMGAAYQRTPLSEREDRAWILTHIAHLELSRGRVEAADRALQAAFALFPNYHYALVQLAKVRAAQQTYYEAVDALQQLVRTAPYPENLYLLGEAQKRAGLAGQAADTFAEFEKKGLLELDWADNSNRELIFYYADHAGRPAEALRIAEKEIAKRHDVYTLDAYAWALFVSGDPAAAGQQLDRALAVGIKDSKLLYHAGMILSKLGDEAGAAGYFRQLLSINPSSEFAAASRDALSQLAVQSVRSLP